MNPRVLLLNPWIYDFAAVNMWSRPLGLLRVAEHLSSFNLDLEFIDCLESFKPRRFNMGNYPKTVVPRPDLLRDINRKYGRYGISIDEFTGKLKTQGPYDAIMVSSMMTYWYPGVQEAIRICKEMYPDVPVIVGGIYATLNEKHARRESGADIVYKGKVDGSIERILDNIGLSVQRIRESQPWYHMGLYRSFDYAPLLTAEGCPFRCSYCASGVINDGYRQNAAQYVIEEIRSLYKLGSKDFAFYDDALLYNAGDHIKKILRGVIDEGIHTRFHTPNGLHAKFLDDELAAFMKQTHFTTIRLSLETVAQARLQRTGDKVTQEELREAVLRLMREGFTKKEIGVYLMYGLPGQEIDEVQESVRFLMELGVTVHLSEFSPIPGTESWNELLAKGTISDDLDPLLSNNTVFSLLFSDYKADDLQQLKGNVLTYNKAA